MLQALLSFILGYFVGTISPAALLSKLRNHNLKQSNTGNLGATNTMLTFGWTSGILVFVLDTLKSFLSFHVAAWLFPHAPLAGLLGGIGAVVGHIYPFYMQFQGGKGSACFGGLILGVENVKFNQPKGMLYKTENPYA